MEEKLILNAYSKEPYEEDNKKCDELEGQGSFLLLEVGVLGKEGEDYA